MQAAQLCCLSVPYVSARCHIKCMYHLPGFFPQVQEIKGCKQRSLYRLPVLGKVRGGYTISPLYDYSLESSPESLITCIIKVGGNSWRGVAEG